MSWTTFVLASLSLIPRGECTPHHINDDLARHVRVEGRDVATTQLFNISDLGMLSSGCSNTLAAPLSCSVLITASLYTWGGLSADNLTTLCTSTCNDSIASYRKAVLAACANDIYTDAPITNATTYVYGTGTLEDIYNVEGISVRPIAFADYYFLNYQLNCMKDTSGDYCYILTGSDATNGTDVNPCGPCGLGSKLLQLEDSRMYDESLASDYSSSVSSCGMTAAPITVPTPVFLPNNNTIVSGYTSTLTCTGLQVPAPTDGSSCDAFAEANSISTDELLMQNGLTGGCADWPGNLASLCIDGSCTPYVVQANDTCLGVSSTNNITLSQLLSWNPTIDPKCVNFEQQVGHVICLSSPAGYTSPNITGLGSAPTPATTPAPVPTDAMTDSNKDCGAWYLVQPNDECAIIATKNGITLSDFYFLNPEINANCTNLWANSSYCVEPVGDITTYPGYFGNTTLTSVIFQTDPSVTWTALATATAPSYPNATSTGYPVANGSVIGCFEMFQNSYGALTCAGVAGMFGVNVLDWIRWNPSVLNGGNYSLDTCVLSNETQYCGSFYNQSLALTTTAIPYLPVPTDATANATTECLEWYRTGSGDACDAICQEYNIPYWAFEEWNPALGASCAIWANSSYCVFGPDGGSVDYNSTSTITGGPPGPTQTGIVAGCTEWYLAQANEQCGWIAGNYSISLAQFYAWNPAVGSSCQYLVPGDAYCVNDPTTLPTTTTTTGITPPGPTQTGIVAGCTKWYLARANDECGWIAGNYSISLAQFYAWNPAVGSSCQYLVPGDAYCVNDPTTLPTTTTTTGITPPGPTQSGIPSDCNAYALSQSGDGCEAFATRNDITVANLYLWNPVLENNCTSFWSDEAYCIGVS